MIEDGSFKISDCYEGVEGLSITVDGGTFDITSENDGLNAGGGNDSSGFWRQDVSAGRDFRLAQVDLLPSIMAVLP